METFDRDDFLRVRGLLQLFNNRLQVTVHRLQRQAVEAIDLTDFFPASVRNPDEMYADLHGIASGISLEPLRSLCLGVIEDPEIAPRLRLAPAAKNVHHAYLGGLLEHVLSMCGMARLLASHYRDIDCDLLLTGVILHDIGKVHELTYDRSFGYSTDGQLLGHIFIGLRMVDEKMRAIPGFPEKLRRLVEHMILSHHGELEYGSPKTPVFPEALLLHHIDNLDSRMECMRALIEKDRFVDGCWTGYNSILERSVLRKQKYLDGADPGTRHSSLVASTDAAASPTPAPLQPSRSSSAPLRSAEPPSRPSSPFAEKLLGALGRKD